MSGHLEIINACTVHTSFFFFFYSGSNMGWVSSGYISSSVLVRLKTVCMCVCLHVCVWPLSPKAPYEIELTLQSRHFLQHGWFVVLKKSGNRFSTSLKCIKHNPFAVVQSKQLTTGVFQLAKNVFLCFFFGGSS